MFTPDTVLFLQENRFRNDRRWFASHKADYERLVLEPLDALSAFVAPVVSAADEWIVTRPASVRSRVYRDLRYVRDGLLYREDMWLSFKRDKKRFPNCPEFIFTSRRLRCRGAAAFTARQAGRWRRCAG